MVRELQEHGYSVIGSDIHPDFKDQTVKYYPANVLDSDSISRVVATAMPDVIFNLAAISSVAVSWKLPQITFETNVVGTINILEAVRKNNKNIKILLVGSSEEYKALDRPIGETDEVNASNPYGISKMVQEKFAEIYRVHHNIKVTCVRAFNHTGVGQSESFVLPSFCKQIANITKSRQNGVVHVGNVSVWRDFSHVKDVVRAYRMIVESKTPKNVYNVGFGRAYKIEELLQYIISLSDQQIYIEEDHSRFRPEDTPLICCNNSLIQKDLGWSPQFTIFDALKEEYDFFLKQKT